MFQLFILVLLIAAAINHTTPHSIRPRCYSDFSFNMVSNNSNQIYRESWKRNCSTNVKSICTKNITISYFDMPPFTNSSNISKFYWEQTGVIQRIISVALAQCCGNCIRLNINKVKDRTALIDMMTKETSDILFPMFTRGMPHQLNASIPPLTIPVLQLPGAMFITKSTISAKLFAKEVISAIVDIWPLLGASIVLAFAAGVFMWILDTWWNKEHFPRRFFTGSFEGFWWAFISMTTVGYGDRAPKSVHGRLFAVFWILCGITIMSLMTAALTTAIGVVAGRQRATVDNGKVGILKDHVFEKIILMRGNAEKVQKDTIDELVSSVSNAVVDAMLVDSLTAKTFKEHFFKDEDLFIDGVIQDVDQSYLGITIYDEGLHSLINEYLDFQHDAIQDYIYNVFRSFEEIKNDKVIANLIFTSDSGVFWPTIYTGIVIIGITLLIGGLYEIYRWKRKSTEKERLSNQELTLKVLKKEEKKMEEELTDLIKKWEKNLLDLMKGYTLRGVLSKTNRTHANIMLKLTPTELDKLGLPDISNDLDYRDSEKLKDNQKLKSKRHKNKIGNGHYEPLENDNSSSLKEDNSLPKTKMKTKVPKKTVGKKAKKIKKSKTSPISYNEPPEHDIKLHKIKKKKSPAVSEEDSEEVEEDLRKPRIRRLPPLKMHNNENYV